MRRYPKKCPDCGSYMEPVFRNGVGNYGVNNYKDRSPIQEPESWKCVDCKVVPDK